MASSTEPTNNGPQDTIPVNLKTPCKVTNVSFEGVHRTRPGLLAKIVSEVFTSTSILDCLQKTTEAKLKLGKLNAFTDVELVLNPINGENQDDPNYEATFVVKERGRLTGSVKTAVDDHSTHLDLKLVIPNISGIGDESQFSSRFNKRFYSGEYRHSVPLIPWRLLWNPICSLVLSQYQWGEMPSGYNQEDKSVVAQVEFLSMPQLHHSISFDNVWRYIKSSNSNSTPIEIREQSGHSLKSSVKHTLTWDTLIGGNFPSDGILAKLSNEVTTNLVTGGAKFTRHEASLQYNALILPRYDVLLQLNLLGGTLLKPSKFNICDKFFAGGPLTVRGFKYQGLGSNRNSYPFGDASYLSAGIHLYSILPYTTPDTPINEFIRPHIFFNTGTIGDINNLRRVSSMDDARRHAINFKDSLRYSCGFGLTMYFMRLRLEVNYCLPLIYKESDLTSRGLQYGFGITYT